MKNIILILITILNFSCNEESETTLEPKNCGCGGPTWMSIPNEVITEVPFEVQTSGVIFFKDDEIIEPYVPDDRWDQKFWIFQGTQGCYNCQRKFIVCNEEFLKSKFDFLKEENNSDSISVTFEGNLMIPCDTDYGPNDPVFIAPADFFYAEIVLTSIEKTN
jgi:hypothetical protein